MDAKSNSESKPTHASAAFTRFPSKLCGKIFSLACLDGGFTGRSLSLVSKSVSEASKPFKLQCLAIRNLSQAGSLARVLTKLPLHERRVVHLYVSCDYPQMYTDLLVFDDSADQEQSAWDRVYSRLFTETGRDTYDVYPIIEELYTIAIIQILTLISPTLRSLWISVRTCGLWIALHCVPELPMLEELTLAYKTEHHPKLRTRLLHSFGPLPALRYLDLSRFIDSGWTPHDLVAQTILMAPSLTTLRIPCVLNQGAFRTRREQPRVQTGWGWSSKEIDTVTDVAGMGDLGEQEKEKRPRLPGTVENIVVVLPEAHEHRNEEMVEACMKFWGNDTRVNCVTPEPAVPGNVVGDRLEKEWLEKLDDGVQCWTNDSDMRGCKGLLYARPSCTVIPSTTTQTGFPSELVDAVIDQVHWDVGSDTSFATCSVMKKSRNRCLGVCSLVCKSWLPRSRYRLFESVSLSRYFIGRTSCFVALLEAPLSTIAPYVRSLTLEEARGRSSGEVRYLNGILSRLAVLSAVESLSISAAMFNVLEAAVTTSFFASFQKLKKLFLHHCTFGSFLQLVGALSAIPDLDHITLYALTIQVNWGSDHFDQCRLDAWKHTAEVVGHSESVCWSPPPRLKTLAIGNVDSKGDILKWLTSGSSVPPVETLQLSIVKAKDSRPIADFLRALRPSLKDLKIDLANKSTGSTDSQGMFHFAYSPLISYLVAYDAPLFVRCFLSRCGLEL